MKPRKKSTRSIPIQAKHDLQNSSISLIQAEARKLWAVE